MISVHLNGTRRSSTAVCFRRITEKRILAIQGQLQGKLYPSFSLESRLRLLRECDDASIDSRDSPVELFRDSASTELLGGNAITNTGLILARFEHESPRRSGRVTWRRTQPVSRRRKYKKARPKQTHLLFVVTKVVVSRQFPGRFSNLLGSAR